MIESIIPGIITNIASDPIGRRLTEGRNRKAFYDTVAAALYAYRLDVPKDRDIDQSWVMELLKDGDIHRWFWERHISHMTLDKEAFVGDARAIIGSRISDQNFESFCYADLLSDLFDAYVTAFRKVNPLEAMAADLLELKEMVLAIYKKAVVDNSEDRPEHVFYGHRYTKSAILEAIEKGQAVQILGDELMGKTACLKWLAQQSFSKQTRTAFVNADDLLEKTPVHLVEEIGRSLGEETAVLRMLSRNENNAAGYALRELAQQEDPLVLLLDNAQHLATREHGFDKGFFDICRGLVESKHLVWVSASREDLYDLFFKTGLTSGFLNGARKVWLGMIARDEVAEMGFTEDHLQSLFDLTGGFAHGLLWVRDVFLKKPTADILYLADEYYSNFSTLYKNRWRQLVNYRDILIQCNDGCDYFSLDEKDKNKATALINRGILKRSQSNTLQPASKAWQRYIKLGIKFSSLKDKPTKEAENKLLLEISKIIDKIDLNLDKIQSSNQSMLNKFGES